MKMASFIGDNNTQDSYTPTQSRRNFFKDCNSSVLLREIAANMERESVKHNKINSQSFLHPVPTPKTPPKENSSKKIGVDKNLEPQMHTTKSKGRII